jgi:hypothetical protein
MHRSNSETTVHTHTSTHARRRRDAPLIPRINSASSPASVATVHLRRQFLFPLTPDIHAKTHAACCFVHSNISLLLLQATYVALWRNLSSGEQSLEIPVLHGTKRIASKLSPLSQTLRNHAHFNIILQFTPSPSRVFHSGITTKTLYDSVTNTTCATRTPAPFSFTWST